MWAEQQGGGSNRDLVWLFAFAGEMPGVPFSCVVAVKGFFCLLQRFVQFASWVVANKILFDPGATVTLNCFKKSMPRMGPATAACRKECWKVFPWNWITFEMYPQVGIGNPFAPLRIGLDGLVLELCGTMLKVVPVLTKKLSFVNSSFKKIKPVFIGNDIALATWTLLSAELWWLGRLFSFQLGCKVAHT